MATFIISDIHGDLKGFKTMLKKIGFRKSEDYLIVNGDVLDRGENGVELLFFVMEMVKHKDALMLKGNHELFAQMYLEGTMTENMWSRFYGASTLRDLKLLTLEKRNEFLDFIKCLPLYYELKTELYGNVVVTHCGLKDGHIVTNEDGKIDVVASINEAYEADEYDLLTSADIHYWPSSTIRNLDRYIICGHQPTLQLGPEYIGKIYKSRYYMDIDAGSGFAGMGGRLACICVDDGKEYYL